jgi:hypothetical protein
MANYELIGLNEAGPDLRAPTGADAGVVSNLKVTTNLTAIAGTANGVVYLNGSKVQTSGSGLQFDATNLRLQGSTYDPFSRFNEINFTLGSNTVGQNTSLNISAGPSAGRGAQIEMGTGGVRYTNITSNASATTFATTTNLPLIFGINDAEAMRLTSTGDLLLGTTVSPSTPVATNRYMRVGVNAIEEASSEITVTSTPQNITRQSGLGGSATIIYYNVSGGAQQTDIVVWTGSAASVIGSAGTSGLTITYGVNTGALTMATASGSAGVFVKALTVQ